MSKEKFDARQHDTGLVVLKDVVITNIETDHWESGGGCPTCDYGKEFVSEVTLSGYYRTGKFTSYSKTLEHRDPYSSSVHLSLSDVIIFFMKNIESFKDMDVAQFEEEIFEKLLGKL